MTASVIARLCWKEYRTLRAFWIAMCVATVGIHAIVYLATPHENDRLGALLFAAAVLPVFYALGCGATLFATEKEAETYDFLRALPAAAWKVCLGKATFAAVSIPLALAMGWLSYLLFAGTWKSPEPNIWWSIGVIGALELFVWSAFFSLILSRPLWSAILGVTVATTVVFGVVSALESFVTLRTYGMHAGIRLAIVAVVAAADVVLALRWFATGRALRSDRRIVSPLARPTASEGAFGDEAVTRWTVLGRLFWQGWRESARTMLILVVICLPAGVFALVQWWRAERAPDWSVHFLDWIAPLAVLLVVAVPGLAGANVFHADQRRPGVGFLAQRGLTAGVVWWSRQLVWSLLAGPLLIAAGVLALVLLLRTPVAYGETRLSADVVQGFLSIPAFVLVSYAIGQMCSMFFRSGILACFFALLGTVGIWAWAMFSWGLELNWAWSLWPVVLAMFLASYLRTSPWMLDRGGLAGWWKPLAVVVLPALAILMATPFVRVMQVPVVSPGFSPEEFAQGASAEAIATREMYVRAAERFVPRPNEGGGAAAPGVEVPPPTSGELDESWLAANREAMTLVETASRRKECDWFQANAGANARGEFQWLAQLFLLRARQAEEEGDLEAAFTDYRTLLRMSVHMRQRAWFRNSGSSIEIEALRELIAWAALPGQEASRILAASKEVDSILSRVPSPTQAIQLQYLAARDMYLGTKTAEELGLNADWAARYWFWQNLLPWEHERAVRVLNQLTADDIARVEGAERAVAAGGLAAPVTWNQVSGIWEQARRRQFVPEMFGLSYYSPMMNIVDTYREEVTFRRAARIILALQAYRAANQALPETLELLRGEYLSELPNDPCSGEPFRYLPQGLPLAMRPPASTTWAPSLIVPQAAVIPAGTPLLWSAGRLMVHAYGPTDLRSHFRVDTGDGYREAATEIEIWQNGWLFPVTPIEHGSNETGPPPSS